MATAVANCCFSVLTSTVKFRCCVSSQRYLATSHHSIASVTCKAVVNHKRRPSSNRDRELEGVSQKKSSRKSKDERSYILDDDDGIRGKRKAGRSQSAAFKSFGGQRKDKNESKFDMKEQQIEPQNLKDAAFLDAVVKVYCTHTEPDYSLPWQKQRQYTSTGSAFMIGNGKLLTNAHCVEHYTQVKVKRRGDDTKYVAKVLARGVDCDIALLSVESEEFWEGAEPLEFGCLPRLQDAVTVVGYPLGGDTISVTKGVVSRIEVTSYAHGSSDLLGIQIDAAINPGNSGGPAFSDQGECIGVAFQVYRSEEVENIGYVIPTTVVSHFLNDYERTGRYTGFPSLGVLLQKLENPALRAWLKVNSNEGVLVRRVEPISDANRVLKEGDVIVSFDDVNVGCEGTVPFRSNERIAFRYLISQKFTGDVAELGIIRAGSFMKVKVVLNPRVNLVPYHVDGGQPSYLIIAGLVFTPLSEPLMEEECEDSIGLKLLAKSRYSLARFKGEQIVIVSQVLANEVNFGYEEMSNQQVLKFNGTQIKNIHHLAHLVDSCKNKYLVFEFEDNYLVVLEREAASASSFYILKDYGIPSERSSDLSEPYVDSLKDNQAAVQDFGNSPISNLEIGFDGLLWA
ncbi:protease Do-like 2, chloroplastic isoform X2 [Populus trichocarpa]|uniref:protease Do-like 2, chloroplastic isoform X2 n=1 Tax=Populus trichocarpa TaxID=3694 RepID=UPI000D18AC3C|nr:protease Do-like 2, chloroplastic isoform X2 [Populus trichocarpa]|eukprot:XP_024450989.1 protease Do-like 2, chloroplastic isoform X2 [Populus trichocarpa]